MIGLRKRKASNQVSDVDKQRLVKTFDALGDETRYRIVQLLISGEDICVSELAEAVGISTPGISQQLKVLEMTGLVRKERMGQKICYRLCREDPLVEQVLPLIA